ncbi:MAG TPA: nuclear transport factor 2 family protein [Chthoniobacter sp.]|jgi:uncharacterized protein (TIGR02246 family)
MKSTFLVAVISTALAGMCFAASVDEVPPEKAAIVANDRAYEAAYAKADVKALADFFTNDASYTTSEGRMFSGRAEIESSIRSAFAGNKGAKLAINVDSVRALGPEALVEKGTTSVTAKNGEVTGELYTAILVKSGGNWKINQLIESPLPDLTPREHLAELEWLVGEWEDTDKTDNVSVHSQYLWARGGNFLTRNITVKKSGEVTLEGWQIIGWDPIEEGIRTWTFDGEGGFSEGRFTRDGDRWLLRETGVTPDGDRTTADNTFTKLGADRYTWESNNRTLDGEPQPSISRIEINRVKGQ